MDVERVVNEQMELISMGTVEIIPLDELREKIRRSVETSKPLTVKLGVDPTRPDLHLGHSVPLTKLRHFQQLGHQVVLIIGDFTALIGDPSEQDETRPVLTPEDVERNARTYVEQASKIIDTKTARIVRNSEWLAPLSFGDVIELASKFTVARIMERDDFSRRLKENKPLGLHEFLYPLMQAYDSVALDADVEIGGTDQKFNLLAGRNLQRSLGKSPQCIITLPLLVGTDGVQKMSKSLFNDIGLTDSPDEMFGKVMSIPDEVMWDYYALVSGLSPREIEDIKSGVEDGEINPRDAKERLAIEIVTRYHGEKEARAAASEFKRIFRERKIPSEVPVYYLDLGDRQGRRVWIVDLLVRVNFAATRSEARRLIAEGGISVDGELVEDVNMEIDPEELKGKIIQKGRRKFVKVELK